MIAALVTLAAGSLASSCVLASVIRSLLADNRRLTAALAAPSREAAQRILDPPTPVRRGVPVRPDTEVSGRPEPIGA